MMSFALVVSLAIIVSAVKAETIENCLEKDSISCVQKALFRQARELFNKPELELVSGISLVKSNDVNERSGRSDKGIVYEQEIESSNSVAERQSSLENFVGEEVSAFLRARSLRINLVPAFEKFTDSARALGDSMPVEIQQAASEFAGEGRGKKKLKKILPLLLLAKAKIGALATLAYFALALIAKKAIIVSLISIALSAFVGVKSLWDKKGSGIPSVPGSGYPPATAYNGGWSSSGGYAAGGASAGWEDGHNYAAQSQAFSGYH